MAAWYPEPVPTSSTRSRPDLEHLGHPRRDLGLGDGLLKTDGERVDPVGLLHQGLFHEEVPRHLQEGAQDRRVLDPGPGEAVHHLLRLRRKSKVLPFRLQRQIQLPGFQLFQERIVGQIQVEGRQGDVAVRMAAKSLSGSSSHRGGCRPASNTAAPRGRCAPPLPGVGPAPWRVLRTPRAYPGNIDVQQGARREGAFQEPARQPRGESRAPGEIGLLAAGLLRNRERGNPEERPSKAAATVPE